MIIVGLVVLFTFGVSRKVYNRWFLGFSSSLIFSGWPGWLSWPVWFLGFFIIIIDFFLKFLTLVKNVLTRLTRFFASILVVFWQEFVLHGRVLVVLALWPPQLTLSVLKLKITPAHFQQTTLLSSNNMAIAERLKCLCIDNFISVAQLNHFYWM